MPDPTDDSWETPTESPERKSAAPAFTRAAAILRIMARDPKRAFGPSDLARAASIPKSSVLNLCSAMLDEGFIRKGIGGFQLSHRLSELGTAYLKSVAEVEEFYEVCRNSLSGAVQTTQLGVLGEGLNVVFLARHDGTDPLNLGLASEIGRLVPANYTAVGRALLAAIGPEKTAKRLPSGSAPMESSTANSIATSSALIQELEQTRQRGYSLERGETLFGLSCMGVAIRTPHRADGVVGVSFSFPDHALPENIDTAGNQLREVAKDLAARIGGHLAF